MMKRFLIIAVLLCGCQPSNHPQGEIARSGPSDLVGVLTVLAVDATKAHQTSDLYFRFDGELTPNEQTQLQEAVSHYVRLDRNVSADDLTGGQRIVVVRSVSFAKSGAAIASLFVGQRNDYATYQCEFALDRGEWKLRRKSLRSIT